jgi:hypothetical protein
MIYQRVIGYENQIARFPGRPIVPSAAFAYRIVAWGYEEENVTSEAYTRHSSIFFVCHAYTWGELRRSCAICKIGTAAMSAAAGWVPTPHQPAID